MRKSLFLIAAFGLLASCVQTPAPRSAAPPAVLRIASWNLEFLAERDGTGCRPRSASEYAEMRRIAESLDADVIAFQEAESVAAAARVFDPGRYTIVMEERAGSPSGNCGGANAAQPFIRQAVGFAVRKGLAFERAPDLVDLQVGNPNLRSGVDITLRPRGGRPLRLLSIHLKSGCFSGGTSAACRLFEQQVPILEKWIDRAASGRARFAVLGDWNRRLAIPGDALWSEIDDAEPGNADLLLSDQGTSPRCDPRYNAFIDHIVLDRRAARDFLGFAETTYATADHPSDHCPLSVAISR